MNFIKRAFLYCIRQKGRTLILFLVLALIATFMLTGFAIRDASKSATEEVQTAVGGRLYLEIDTEGNYDSGTFNSFGTGYTYQGDYITSDIVKAVSSVDGVVDYNVEDTNTWFAAGVNYDYFPTSWSFGGYETEYGDESEYVACLSSEKCTAFENGKYTLVEGRHITPEDSHAVLISKELADYNNLSVGDNVQMYNMDLKAQGFDAIVEVEIVGIFDGTEGTSTGNEIAVEDMEANCGFIDYKTVLDSFQLDVEYSSLMIYVEDPTSIQNVYDEIAELPELKGKTLKLSIDTDEYDVISTPLESLQSLVSTAVVIIIVISLFILTLLLTLWIRGRKKEIGIYLSIGTDRFNILGQFFMETFMVALVAFVTSLFFSNLIADKVGTFLAARVSSRASALDVQVSASYLPPVYLVGTGIIAIAVLVSSWTVLRLKPRDILSKMS